jgi:hypothetical protein
MDRIAVYRIPLYEATVKETKKCLERRSSERQHSIASFPLTQPSFSFS